MQGQPLEFASKPHTDFIFQVEGSQGLGLLLLLLVALVTAGVWLWRRGSRPR